MKTHKTIFSILLLYLFGAFTGFAEIFNDSVRVHFRVSDIKLDKNYKGNGNELDSLIRKISADSISGAKYRLLHVNVTGGASPEGSVKFNQYLSEKRADAIFNEFCKRGLANDSDASFIYLGRDWNGLKREVNEDREVPYREDVVALLDKVTGTTPPANPLDDLKAIRAGVPYQYMLNNLFPELRGSQVTIEYEKLFPKIKVPEMNPDLPRIIAVPDSVAMIFNRFGASKKCRPFYMGLKTNMLYDALLLPNIGAEFYIGKNWSVIADWMYGWWDRDRSHYYWRAYGGNLGARWWFGKKATERPLTGHHIGLFAGVITYDFELGRGGIMGGLPRGTLWDRCNFVSGVEYGYSLPVARRLNIDFTVGFGYMGGKYLNYEPKYSFYIWQSTHHISWIGPTKAEISLVWLLGCDNYNRKKGGMR